jgi:hypothetical protein
VKNYIVGELKRKSLKFMVFFGRGEKSQFRKINKLYIMVKILVAFILYTVCQRYHEKLCRQPLSQNAMSKGIETVSW